MWFICQLHMWFIFICDSYVIHMWNSHAIHTHMWFIRDIHMWFAYACIVYEIVTAPINESRHIWTSHDTFSLPFPFLFLAPRCLSPQPTVHFRYVTMSDATHLNESWLILFFLDSGAYYLNRQRASERVMGQSSKKWVMAAQKWVMGHKKWVRRAIWLCYMTYRIVIQLSDTNESWLHQNESWATKSEFD